MVRRLLAAAFFAIALPALHASAQQEFRLDPSGTWVPAQAAPASDDEALLARARQLLADDRPRQAHRLVDEWIERHQTQGHDLLAPALLIRGDAMVAMGDEFKALYDYEDIAINHAGSEEFIKAAQRELDIAVKYVNGMRRKWLGLRIAGAESIGEELLTRIQERLPGTPLAERANVELADYYYRNRELVYAADAYEIYEANFPAGPNLQRARERRIYANLGRFKGPNYDSAGLVDARGLIQDYIARDPISAQRAGISDALITRIDEAMASQLLERADWYLRRNDPVSARATYRRLVERFPQTAAGGRALDELKDRGWTLEPAPASAQSDADGIAPADPAPAASPAEEPRP